MKKLFSLLLAVTIVSAGLAGCAENANQNTNTASTAGASSATDASQVTGTSTGTDDVLRIALASGGRTLDPAAATDGISATFVNAAYDQLVAFGTTEKNGLLVADPETIVPSLAKSWEVSEDGLTYVFNLDETATFANGDAVTADAVIFSLERVKNSPTSSFLFALSNIDTMEKLSDTSVQFNLSKPCTILFKLLQMHILSIINPNELADIDDIDTYLSNNTAGSGAYIIEKWEPASEAILIARTDYWKGTPPNSQVHIQFIPEAANRVLLAEKGDVDIALSIPPKDLDVLENNSSLQVNIYESNMVSYIAFNNDVAPFNDVLVRQALNYAIPYDDIVNEILNGKAATLSYVIPSAMPGYLENPTETRSLDLTKAAELLEQAGYADGFSFKLTVSNSNQDGLDAAVLIQAELAKINVTVEIDQMEASQYTEAVKQGNIEAAICSYTAFVNDPGYFFGNTLNSQGEYNYANYASAEVDALWEEAESTNDVELRYENYAAAQEIVFEDAPWAVLYEGRTIVVLNESVTSYLHYPDGSLRFYTIEKE